VRAARRGNADEIVRGLQELGAMQATGAALRAQLGEAQAGLAAAGGAFLRVLEMMQETSRVQAAIRDSRQARPRARPARPRAPRAPRHARGGAGPAHRGAVGSGSPEAACNGWCGVWRA